MLQATNRNEKNTRHICSIWTLPYLPLTSLIYIYKEADTGIVMHGADGVEKRVSADHDSYCGQ